MAYSNTTVQPGTGYLNGTQIGGVLGGLQQQQQGQQAQTAYSPGQGMAPYGQVGPGTNGGGNNLNSLPTQGLSSASQGANVGANLNTYQGVMAAENSGAVTNPFLQNMQAQTNGQGTFSVSGNAGALSGALSGASYNPETPSSNNGGPTINGPGSTSSYTSQGPMGGISGGSGGGGSGGSGGGLGGFTSGASPTGSNTTPALTPQQIAQSGANTLHPNPGSTTIPNVMASSPQSNTASSLYGASTAPTSGSGTLQMEAANPQTGLSQYDNSLANQVLNTPGAYQQSPGYQFAVQQAMQAANQQGASQGLLGSGALAKAETTQASGMAMQDYNNWWNQQSGLVSNYQNQLAGLAGGQTGGSAALATGQNLAGNTTTAGQNVSGLLANQGNTDASGMLNTGSAQSGNIMNSGNNQAQIDSTNSNTQIGAATSGLF
jgi:hypothetical protein